LQEALTKAPLAVEDYSLVELNKDTDRLTVNYAEIIALNTLQIKALKSLIKQLEAQIIQLKGDK
jgi:hypothetical protein